MTTQRREYFRLAYPKDCRPTLSSQQHEFEVLDVSEYGLKFHTDGLDEFSLGQKMMAHIRFYDDEEYECMGKIIRLGDSEVAVNLTLPLPLQKIRSEHIFLINKFSSVYN